MQSHKHAIQRLTLLWAFSEAGLGGLLHAFRLPFTGLLVGGTAVILITLIASYSKERFRDILKATVLVLLVKAAVSPHTPVMAYLAVSFQGVIGAILFGLLPGYRLPALLLGLLALVESSLQKLFTLTVIYGRSLWEALDAFFHYVGKQLGVATEGLSLSYGLIGGYVGLYVVGGVVVGWLAGRMVTAIRQLPAEASWHHLDLERLPQQTSKSNVRHRKWVVYVLILAVMVVMLLWLQPGESAGRQALYVIVRSLVVVVLWWWVLTPLLKRAISRFLSRQRTRYTGELEAALVLLPLLRRAAAAIWVQTRGQGVLRFWYFLITLIHFTLTWQIDTDAS